MGRRLYPRGTSHVAIVVADLAASERFYLGVLGLELILRRDDDAGRHRATWVKLDGESFLAIERGEPKAGRSDTAPGLHCLALRIEQTERAEWLEHLATSGVPVERTSAYTLYVRDPDGVLIGLSHYPDAATST